MELIGREVVCIKPHPDGLLKLNEPYIIRDFVKCKCGHVMYDVGLKRNNILLSVIVEIHLIRLYMIIVDLYS